MSIRFCEFCSTVHSDDTIYCPDCGTRLIQSATEKYFNDSDNPWPFQPVNRFCLRIQGQPRNICFSGTHSVFHLWSALYSAYEQMRLYYRVKQDELELVGFPPERDLAELKRLDPAMLLNCKYRRFSFHTYGQLAPEMADEPAMIYQGSFEIEDCPPKAWGNVLGWLVATAPRPEPDNNWTYDI